MSSESKTKQPRRFKVKAWHLLLLVIAVLCTFGLAYWQWTRFQSGSGTFQNLGYAFQWPLFGAFFVYAYKQILAYENDRYDAITAEDSTVDSQTYVAKDVQDKVATSIDESFLPQRPQISVEDFNKMNDPQRRRKHQ